MTSTQRERRLFEALYALAKAAEMADEEMARIRLQFGESDVWLSALAEAEEALAYREEKADD